MKKNILAALFISAFVQAGGYAQNFNDFFIDKTLRIDYLFNGNAQKQDISLDELVSLPGWAGRRNFLSELPLEGNGEITMRDKATGEVIYSRMDQRGRGKTRDKRIRKYILAALS